MTARHVRARTHVTIYLGSARARTGRWGSGARSPVRRTHVIDPSEEIDPEEEAHLKALVNPNMGRGGDGRRYGPQRGVPTSRLPHVQGVEHEI